MGHWGRAGGGDDLPNLLNLDFVMKILFQMGFLLQPLLTFPECLFDGICGNIKRKGDQVKDGMNTLLCSD